MPDKKITREELAAKLEAKAKELRENRVSDEDVEKMSAGCTACCGGCQVSTYECFSDITMDHYCRNSCVKSSPN